MTTVPSTPRQSMKQAVLPAARIGDHHSCPRSEPGPVPHVGGPLLGGSTNVFIEGIAAARVGDQAVCAGPPDVIKSGSATVFINRKAAARSTDPTEHGGVVVGGASRTFIGDGPGKGDDPSDCMKSAAESGDATIVAKPM